MKLTKAQLRNIRLALHTAIKWEDSLADAHHAKYNPKGPHLPRIVPAEHRAIVRLCERRIRTYRKLLDMLSVTQRGTTL